MTVAPPAASLLMARWIAMLFPADWIGAAQRLAPWNSTIPALS